MNSIIKILPGFLKGLLKAFMVFISYRSVKRVINRYPEPVRKIIIFCIRLTVFLCIFLFLYSFLTTRVYSITAHNNTPGVLSNIFIGIIFVISLVVSFFSTAVVEDIYSLPSSMKQSAKEGIDGVKEGAKKGANVSADIVKKSIISTTCNG